MGTDKSGHSKDVPFTLQVYESKKTINKPTENIERVILGTILYAQTQRLIGIRSLIFEKTFTKHGNIGNRIVIDIPLRHSFLFTKKFDVFEVRLMILTSYLNTICGVSLGLALSMTSTNNGHFEH